MIDWSEKEKKKKKGLINSSRKGAFILKKKNVLDHKKKI